MNILSLMQTSPQEKQNQSQTLKFLNQILESLSPEASQWIINLAQKTKIIFIKIINQNIIICQTVTNDTDILSPNLEQIRVYCYGRIKIKEWLLSNALTLAPQQPHKISLVLTETNKNNIIIRIEILKNNISYWLSFVFH